MNTEAHYSNPCQFNLIRSDPIRSDPIQSNPIRSNPIQFNPIQSDTILKTHHSTDRHPVLRLLLKTHHPTDRHTVPRHQFKDTLFHRQTPSFKTPFYRHTTSQTDTLFQGTNLKAHHSTDRHAGPRHHFEDTPLHRQTHKSRHHF